jgi:hypothetical protein
LPNIVIFLQIMWQSIMSFQVIYRTFLRIIPVKILTPLYISFSLPSFFLTIFLVYSILKISLFYSQNYTLQLSIFCTRYMDLHLPSLNFFSQLLLYHNNLLKSTGSFVLIIITIILELIFLIIFVIYLKLYLRFLTEGIQNNFNL